jgi:hypothetical protein
MSTWIIGDIESRQIRYEICSNLKGIMKFYTNGFQLEREIPSCSPPHTQGTSGNVC